jgi:hypothetical protein
VTLRLLAIPARAALKCWMNKQGKYKLLWNSDREPYFLIGSTGGGMVSLSLILSVYYMENKKL